MTTRYYVEVDVDPVPPDLFLSIEKALSRHIDAELTWDLRPDTQHVNGSCHGYMDVFTNAGTKGAHKELVDAVRAQVPGANVTTRWICWEEINFEDTYDTAEEEED